MVIRAILHYLNGKTDTLDWGYIPNLKKAELSSIQLQSENEILGTLSNNNNSKFKVKNYCVDGIIKSMSIMRNLSDTLWLSFTIDYKTGNKTVSVIKENKNV